MVMELGGQLHTPTDLYFHDNPQSWLFNYSS